MVASGQLASAPDIAQLRQDLHLSRERMGRLLDVSAKTVERWEAMGNWPASVRHRRELARIREIVSLGQVVYSPEGFSRFLTVPLPAFDGRTALQTMERGDLDTVLAALAADYEGLGY